MKQKKDSKESEENSAFMNNAELKRINDEYKAKIEDLYVQIDTLTKETHVMAELADENEILKADLRRMTMNYNLLYAEKEGLKCTNAILCGFLMEPPKET